MKSLSIGSVFLCSVIIFEIAVAQAFEFLFFFDSDEEVLIREDLEFLFSLKLDAVTPLHHLVFGGAGGDAYRSYFHTRAKSIRRSLSSYAAYAFVAPYNSPGYHDRIAVTSKFFELSQLMRISVLVHEARHSEVDHDYWHHVTCPSPYLDERGIEMRTKEGVSLAGRRQACDQSAMGSFGVVVIMLNGIANHCTNCSEEIRHEAAFLSQDIVKRIIDPSERKRLTDDLELATAVP